MEYAPARRPDLGVVKSAQNSGKQASAAFNSGHPAVGLAHIGYQAAKAAYLYYQGEHPRKCKRCRMRS
jgi:hypothetical protein